VASGLQLFVMGAVIAWTPSYLNRTYAMAPDRAAVVAAMLLLSCGAGMILCGVLSDRICAGRPQRRVSLAAGYGLATFICLEAALALPAGPLQLSCGLLGLFCAAGTTGPAGSIVADRTPLALHGAALAVLTLANNLIGLAPGPAVTGALADRVGLHAALQFAVTAALAAGAVFWLSGRLTQSSSNNGPKAA
jgi:MFS family permease